MTEPIINVRNATAKRDGRVIFSGLNWSCREGETWALVGPTGSGKTAFAELLLGRHFMPEGLVSWPLLDRLHSEGQRIDYPSQVVAHVTFKEESRLFSYAGHYYQQRYEFADADEPLSLQQFLQTRNTSPHDVFATAERLGIAAQLPQPFMTLSNGQTRRARLARALLRRPEFLILDDPFIGLDTAGRLDLTELLSGLVREGRRILLICREDAIPSWVTHVLHAGTWSEARNGQSELRRTPTRKERSASRQVAKTPGEALVELTEVSVAHGGKAILDRISWTVRSGERWAVVGPNGSGKTTLLSLLCGDHPQAYSNDVRLFGAGAWNWRNHLGCEAECWAGVARIPPIFHRTVDGCANRGDGLLRYSCRSSDDGGTDRSRPRSFRGVRDRAFAQPPVSHPFDRRTAACVAVAGAGEASAAPDSR